MNLKFFGGNRLERIVLKAGDTGSDSLLSVLFFFKLEDPVEMNYQLNTRLLTACFYSAIIPLFQRLDFFTWRS